MTDPPIPTPSKKRPAILRNIFLGFIGLVILFLVGSYLSLNYFGEKILRQYLKNKINHFSQGLYDVDFGKLTYNLFTGKLTIHDFILTPDTILYQKLKSLALVKKSLYQVSVKSVSIDHVYSTQIFSSQKINIQTLDFFEPVINIVGFPDTMTARKNRWRIIYEDIYPLISNVFTDFHVDSVKIIDGFLLTSFRQHAGRLTHGEYEFSSVLRDVSVNEFSYYNRERVFYSKDIDFIIYDFEYCLADSLYFLKADEIGFSLTRSTLYGKQVSLRPNFHSKRIRTAHNGDFYQIEVPDFSIKGIDLYKALVDKEVKIQKVNLGNFGFKLFRNKKQTTKTISDTRKKKLRIATLYTVISGVLKSVSIDSFSLKKAYFEYFSGLTETNPTIRIAEVNLDLSGFYIDSLAHLDKEKIFYANNIELEARNFSVAFRDEVHFMNLDKIRISTRKSQIDVQDGLIYPDNETNILLKSDQKNTVYCLLPRLTFYKINLKKVFNNKIFDFDKLEILEPEIKFTRFKKTENQKPKFNQPEDFFEEENENLIFNLLKKYLKSIEGNSILLSNGFIQFAHFQHGLEKKTASGSFDLTMNKFLIDSLHGLNRQGYFYSRDFDLDIGNIFYESLDSLRHFKAERFHISTPDSLIEAFSCSLIQTSSPIHLLEKPASRSLLSLDFYLPHLRISGLNHKKLFLEKVLKANTILFENPEFEIKTGTNSKPLTSADQIYLSPNKNIIRTFDIGRVLIKNGSISYSGKGEQKTSFFSLRGVDFEIVNSQIRLPDNKKSPGIIKFDSLRLSVYPIRAILDDSTYLLQCNRISVHSYPAEILISGLKISPLKPIGKIHKTNFLATINIKQVNIDGFYFDKAIFDKQWNINEMHLENPTVYLEMNKENNNKDSTQPNQNHSFRLPPFINSLQVRRTTLIHASAEIKSWINDSVQTRSLTDFFLSIDGFRMDSASKSDWEKSPLFFSDDIQLKTKQLSWYSKDSMYAFSLKELGFSTHDKKIYIDSLKVNPRFSREDFSKKLGYQSDRLVANFQKIEAERFDFQKLVTEKKIMTEHVHIRGMNLESYRDRRIPLSSSLHPLLPLAMIKNIPYPLTIDTLILSDGQVVYEEQLEEEPGKIFFNQMNAEVINLTNDHSVKEARASMDLYGTAYLMGKAPIEAWFHFPLQSSTDSFSFKGTIGELSLSEINPMLTKLVPIKISNGVATKTEINNVYANENFSHGKLEVQYKNLTVQLKSTEKDKWSRLGIVLLNEAINIILPDNNPNDNGKLRTGVIYYERDKRKGFFNFIWKSTLSGLKSTLGFNSKMQKELKKKHKKSLK